MKTLVVFDTNSLRNLKAGQVAYNAFSFNKTYDLLDTFVKENNLTEKVTLAVSSMVIEELKNQKSIQYKKDIDKLKEIARRMNGMPHIDENTITIPDEKFDIAGFIEAEAKKYFEANRVNVIEYKDEHFPSMLKNMLHKVIGRDRVLSPFFTTKEHSDAGFKDNVIWETIMHYEKNNDYDKIIFFTADGDYLENCKEDFESKWKRYIFIEKDVNNVIYQLTKDYEKEIIFKKLFVYANSEVFRDTLKKELDEMTLILIDEIEYPIEKYEIKEYCSEIVENIPQKAEEDITYSFTAVATFHYKWDDDIKNIDVSIKTTVEKETNEIIRIEYSHGLSF